MTFSTILYRKKRDFLLSSGKKKTTERTDDTENYSNSVISASSVVDYPYLDHLSGGIKKSQFLNEITSNQKKLKRIKVLLYCFSPFIVITVCLIGRTLPDFFTASSAILCNPKQQGTSMLTRVMLLILLVLINSVNLSI